MFTLSSTKLEYRDTHLIEQKVALFFSLVICLFHLRISDFKSGIRVIIVKDIHTFHFLGVATFSTCNRNAFA
jgi:hypothetical protein